MLDEEFEEFRLDVAHIVFVGCDPSPSFCVELEEFVLEVVTGSKPEVPGLWCVAVEGDEVGADVAFGAEDASELFVVDLAQVIEGVCPERDLEFEQGCWGRTTFCRAHTFSDVPGVLFDQFMGGWHGGSPGRFSTATSRRERSFLWPTSRNP